MSDMSMQQFLTGIATDSVKLECFKADPELYASSAGLSADDAAIVSSRDPQKIYAALKDGHGVASETSVLILIF